MKIRFLKLSSIAAISFLAVSCTNADSDQAIVEEEVVEEVVNEVSEDPIDEIFYQVPSPNDLFNVLKDADISYNKDILNDLSLVETFNTKK